MDFISNNWSFGLSLAISVPVIIICIRDYQSAKRERRTKVWSIIIFIFTFVATWGNYIYQIDNSKRIRAANINLQLKLDSIKEQNAHLKNLGINSLKTINSLHDKLDKNIETINNLNKQKKIDLLNNLKKEIAWNMKIFERDLLGKKELFTEDGHHVTMANFSCESIKRNIGNGTINNAHLLGELHYIHMLFNTSNNYINLARKETRANVRISNMNTMFESFNDKTLKIVNNFLKGLGEYMQKIKKE